MRGCGCPPGGAVDAGPAGGQHRVRGGALPQVPLPPGGAAQLPEDGAEPRHQERGMQYAATAILAPKHLMMRTETLPGDI